MDFYCQFKVVDIASLAGRMLIPFCTLRRVLSPLFGKTFGGKFGALKRLVLAKLRTNSLGLCLSRTTGHD
jgi:hypothetical protein